ncbi:MAG: hypothetical protein IPL04_06640 [Chitinophagaceae bacterium]|nr:hypothetical protein [Chitinophagaceae bacterium]
MIINTSCANTISVKTDVWGSNVNSPDPKAQCYQCALPQFFNDPKVTGFKNCAQPARQYSIGITTVDPTPKNVTYKVYLDADGSGNINAGDVLAFTSAPISISSTSSYASGLVALPPPYSNTKPYSEYNYLILVEGATLSNSVVQLLDDPGCIPLPVDLKTFTETRNKANVILKWTTSTERIM